MSASANPFTVTTGANTTGTISAWIRSAPALPDIERREVELRKEQLTEDGDRLIFEGRAAVFNEWADIGGAFRERIKRGAFRKLIQAGTDTVFAFNHNLDLTMAGTRVAEGPGMLQLSESGSGLEVYAELVPTSAAQDLRALVTAGVVRKMSFGWPRGATEDRWNDDYTEREIVEFRDLIDVSPVVFPAYAGTEAGMRSIVDALAESFDPATPVEDRVAAYTSLLDYIRPDSVLAGEIKRRAIGLAPAADAPAGEAETDADSVPWRLLARKRRAHIRSLTEA